MNVILPPSILGYMNRLWGLVSRLRYIYRLDSNFSSTNILLGRVHFLYLARKTDQNPFVFFFVTNAHGIHHYGGRELTPHSTDRSWYGFEFRNSSTWLRREAQNTLWVTDCTECVCRTRPLARMLYGKHHHGSHGADTTTADSADSASSKMQKKIVVQTCTTMYKSLLRYWVIEDRPPSLWQNIQVYHAPSVAPTKDNQTKKMLPPESIAAKEELSKTARFAHREGGPF